MTPTGARGRRSTPKRITVRMLVRLFQTGYSIRGVARHYQLPYWDVENRIRDWMRRR